jgi:hypothetical protein
MVFYPPVLLGGMMKAILPSDVRSGFIYLPWDQRLYNSRVCGETILLNYANFWKISCPISDFASFSWTNFQNLALTVCDINFIIWFFYNMIFLSSPWNLLVNFYVVAGLSEDMLKELNKMKCDLDKCKDSLAKVCIQFVWCFVAYVDVCVCYWRKTPTSAVDILCADLLTRWIAGPLPTSVYLTAWNNALPYSRLSWWYISLCTNTSERISVFF